MTVPRLTRFRPIRVPQQRSPDKDQCYSESGSKPCCPDEQPFPSDKSVNVPSAGRKGSKFGQAGGRLAHLLNLSQLRRPTLCGLRRVGTSTGRAATTTPSDKSVRPTRAMLIAATPPYPRQTCVLCVVESLGRIRVAGSGERPVLGFDCTEQPGSQLRWTTKEKSDVRKRNFAT